MKRFALILLAFGMLVGLAYGGLDWVNFTVTRHVNTTYTTAEFDNAMTDVNDRLKYDNHDCTDDVPCSARFQRSGVMGTFGTTTDGLDVITTQAELNSVFGILTHRAKVVVAVDYCSGTYNPSYIGCGRCDAFGFIVEEGMGGHVYVHEFGHNVIGCGHRDDCDHNIMNTYSIGTNNSVNASECSDFGGKAYIQLCGTVYDGAGGPLTAAAGPYWITCNVTVPAGRILTIGAGVEIQFHQGLRITSEGTANADGSTTRINLYSNNEGSNYPTAIVDGEMVISNGGVLIFD